MLRRPLLLLGRTAVQDMQFGVISFGIGCGATYNGQFIPVAQRSPSGRRGSGLASTRTVAAFCPTTTTHKHTCYLNPPHHNHHPASCTALLLLPLLDAFTSHIVPPLPPPPQTHTHRRFHIGGCLPGVDQADLPGAGCWPGTTRAERGRQTPELGRWPPRRHHCGLRLGLFAAPPPHPIPPPHPTPDPPHSLQFQPKAGCSSSIIAFPKWLEGSLVGLQVDATGIPLLPAAYEDVSSYLSALGSAAGACPAATSYVGNFVVVDPVASFAGLPYAACAAALPGKTPGCCRRCRRRRRRRDCHARHRRCRASCVSRCHASRCSTPQAPPPKHTQELTWTPT